MASTKVVITKVKCRNCDGSGSTERKTIFKRIKYIKCENCNGYGFDFKWVEVMTHDELLLKMANRPLNYEGGLLMYKALHDVVELHKQTKAIKGADEYDACKHCYPTVYPCPTIQAIEKELA